MKNLRISLIVLFVSFFVSAINAQQTVYINKKTVRTDDNVSVKIKFDVDKITNAAQAETLRTKLAANKGVFKVTASSVNPANQCTFTMTYPKAQFKLQNLQDALIASGLNNVMLNQESIKTADLVTHSQKKK